MSRAVFIAAACMLLATTVQAEQIKVYFTSGTGFFVDNSGNLLTNNHVVKNCLRLTVSDRDSTHSATITATDPANDLALLATGIGGTQAAQLRTTNQPLEVGERVVLVGYPGESYKTGTVTREAKVIANTGPKGEPKWLQLSDVVVQGNSGGPLLDGSGNVVGVVSAKAVIYTFRQDAPEQGTTSNSGIAISLGVLRDFLDGNHINYRMANAGYFLTADRVTDEANRFVVNVRCETKSEVVR